MTGDLDYFFGNRPLYTEKAIDVLEGKQIEIDGEFREGRSEQVPVYASLEEEKKSLENYLDRIEQYDDFMMEAYEDTDNVPGVHVLARVEEDMDMMARERDHRLDDITFTGDDRREALDEILPDEFDRPVLADTWIIMNEAEELREYLESNNF